MRAKVDAANEIADFGLDWGCEAPKGQKVDNAGTNEHPMEGIGRAWHWHWHCWSPLHSDSWGQHLSLRSSLQNAWESLQKMLLALVLHCEAHGQASQRQWEHCSQGYHGRCFRSSSHSQWHSQ